jgi:hypothetical protein
METLVAGGAPTDQASADLNVFRFDAFVFKSFEEPSEQMIRVAPRTGASVKADDLHQTPLPGENGAMQAL